MHFDLYEELLYLSEIYLELIAYYLVMIEHCGAMYNHQFEILLNAIGLIDYMKIQNFNNPLKKIVF